MNDADFLALYLHDSKLLEMNYVWNNSQLTLHLKADVYYERARGYNPVKTKLIWEGVQNVSIPHKAPWGDSLYINEHSLQKGEHSINVYEILMGSGDIIRIEAQSVELLIEE